MIRTEQNISIGAHKTCTVDEAVASLLGWIEGDIPTTGHSGAAVQLSYLQSRGSSPLEILARCVDAAADELSDAFTAKADQSVIDEKINARRYWAGEALKASQFERDIKKELAKKFSSALRLNQDATKRHGSPCIYVGDINRWAQKKYGSTVFQSMERTVEAGKIVANSEVGKGDGPSPKDGLDAVRAITLPITDTDLDQLQQSSAAAVPQANPFEGRNSNKGMSRKSVDSLYLTLAFLIELFVEAKQKEKVLKGGAVPTIEDFIRDDGALIVKKFAEYMEDVIARANGREFFPGQGWESIKDKVDAAQKVKRMSFSSK